MFTLVTSVTYKFHVVISVFYNFNYLKKSFDDIFFRFNIGFLQSSKTIKVRGLICNNVGLVEIYLITPPSPFI